MDLATYGVQRGGEIGAVSGSENGTEMRASSEQHKSLTHFRLAKELGQMQSYTLQPKPIGEFGISGSSYSAFLLFRVTLLARKNQLF